ncbi:MULTISPECIES: hypothetical protein [Streptomyces]|uniref:hypothetical protein n=1 Tax=Streptomyces TaxID=1883 RepID=UPI001E392708|nr:hypothetical protein [Streptomyces sp. Z423-1]
MIRAAEVPSPVGADGRRGPPVAFGASGSRGDADARAVSSARTSPATSWSAAGATAREINDTRVSSRSCG